MTTGAHVRLNRGIRLQPDSVPPQATRHGLNVRLGRLNRGIRLQPDSVPPQAARAGLNVRLVVGGERP
jgi:hypothetical protein